MKFSIITLSIILFLASNTSSASSKKEATDILTDFFKNLKTLTADFEQVVENSQLSSISQANGKLYIQRPGKFRWDYLAPYEQEIVSDGEKLWIFDKDLEQVTVRNISGSLENTPAVLLSDSKPISDTFTIKVIGKIILLNWIELSPKDTEASFTTIRLGFDGKVLSEMLLEDSLGQTTQIKFRNLKRNLIIQQKKFNFIPPKGIDVFESS